MPPATPLDDGAEAVLRQIAKDFEADERLQQLLKRLGLQGKVPSPLATSAPGLPVGQSPQRSPGPAPPLRSPTAPHLRQGHWQGGIRCT